MPSEFIDNEYVLELKKHQEEKEKLDREYQSVLLKLKSAKHSEEIANCESQLSIIYEKYKSLAEKLKK